MLTRYIPVESLLFYSFGTIFFSLNAQVTWHDERHSIFLLNQSCRSSLKSGGTWHVMIHR